MTTPAVPDPLAELATRWDTYPDPVHLHAFALGAAADTTASAVSRPRLVNEASAAGAAVRRDVRALRDRVRELEADLAQAGILNTEVNGAADRYRDLVETGATAIEGFAATLAVYGAGLNAQYARELAARLRAGLAEVAGGPRG